MSENYELDTQEVSIAEKEKTKKKKVVEQEEVSDVKKAKLEALEKVVLSCDKDFGKNTLIKLDDTNITRVPMVSSEILSLDDVLGGGFPKGRIIEIYGPESSGKTTLALHAIAKVQKEGGIAAFVDAEHALDTSYAQKLGVDVNNLYLTQPDSAEQALEITDRLIDSGAINIVVIDSVSALVPQAEEDGDFGQSHMGLQARLMGQAMRKLVGKAGKNETIVVFINQIRMKIGVMFGSPETTSGGQALKFAASQRIDIRKIETLNADGKDEDATANRVRIKCVKNKVGIPFKKCELTLEFNKGFNSFEDAIDVATKFDIIIKSGSWFSLCPELGGQKLGQGKPNVIKYFEENPQEYDKMYNLAKMKLNEKNK